MKMSLKTVTIAVASLASATLFSPGWTEQGGWSLATSKAEAQARVYITRGYAASSGYTTATGLSWYPVRAYYFGGPWSGPGWSYTGWSDYAGRNGIGCTPGTAIKGGDGIMYLCQ
ncbi:hypothetical protein CQ14_35195 [Bradyrhizobium lablabi]|uniref:Uncharacterized protein n=2 Tax=Bradyrhizobium lablabi TaxID=722472 RepID=A0A0R3MP52_9BRAD|nr:hypothetical protein CQ14_35195 [Bradyrhizobium lablabi]